MIGREVYVKLDLIDLSEVNRVLPRKHTAYLVGPNVDDPMQPIETPHPVLFSDVEAFSRTEFVKGKIVSVSSERNQYREGREYTYLVELEGGRVVSASKIYEADEYDRAEPDPEEGNADGGSEEAEEGRE